MSYNCDSCNKQYKTRNGFEKHNLIAHPQSITKNTSILGTSADTQTDTSRLEPQINMLSLRVRLSDIENQMSNYKKMLENNEMLQKINNIQITTKQDLVCVSQQLETQRSRIINNYIRITNMQNEVINIIFQINTIQHQINDFLDYIDIVKMMMLNWLCLLSIVYIIF